MRYGSVCSGISAASVAWKPLGWEPAWFAEIEPFPSAVLAHRHPGVPNLGDMTGLAARIRAGEVEAPDVLEGGTPCQAFSVAGLGGSLSDERGNLALAFVRIADAIDAVRASRGEAPCWIVWENVPGVLSTDDNAFGALLGGLVGSDSAIEAGLDGWPGAGVVHGPRRAACWRTVDSQFFGVAQRRRRVYLCARGHPRAWDAADALLPVVQSSAWHPRPSRPARAGATGGAQAGARGGGIPDVAGTLGSNAHGGHRIDLDSSGAYIVEPIPFDTTQVTCPNNYSSPRPGDPCHPLAATAHPPAVAIAGFPDPAYAVTPGPTGSQFGTGRDAQDTFVAAYSIVPEGGQGADPRASEIETAPAITTEEAKSIDRGTRIAYRTAVRRLTETECERLQAFPDGYTAIPGAKGSARYRALGNSMTTKVMRWVGERIEAVERRVG